MKKLRYIIPILALSLVALTYPYSKAYAAFSFSRSITVQASQVTGTLSSFPMLVSGTYNGSGGTLDLRTVGNGGKVQNANGYDVGFYSDSACTSKLNWETEKYVASTGEVDYWINVSSMAVGSVIYICYGDASIVADQSNASAVWSAYTMVQHLAEATNAQAVDSTSNGNNSTTNSSTAAAGQVDGAQSFVSASTNSIAVPSIASLNGATSAVMQVWFKRTAASGFISWGEDLNSAGQQRFGVQGYSDGNMYVAVGNGASNDAYCYFGSNDTSWHEMTMIYSAGGLNVYMDGVSQGFSGCGGALPAAVHAASAPFYFGRDLSGGGTGHYSDGTIDEGRLIIGSTLTASWIAAEFKNQSAPATFYAIGSENSLTPPIVTTASHIFVFAANHKFILGANHQFIFN